MMNNNEMTSYIIYPSRFFESLFMYSDYYAIDIYHIASTINVYLPLPKHRWRKIYIS